MIEQLRGGVFANKGHNGYSKTYTCSNFGQVDYNLYGGGKHGDDTKLVIVSFSKKMPRYSSSY
jgi:hypothetical protein